MALAKFHCEKCEQDFTAGDWMCKSGDAHVVPTEIYYVMDAPSDKTDVQAMKSASTTMCNLIPERKMTNGNEVVIIPGRDVKFIRGSYSTPDPQLQNALNQRAKVFRGDEGKKMWEREYLTKDEKSEMERLRQTAYINRLENDKNELLEKLKEKSKAVAPAQKAS